MVEPLRQRLAHHRTTFWSLLIIGCIALHSAPITAAADDIPGDVRTDSAHLLQSISPLLFFTAFTILPTLGFPLTLFYLTIGGVITDPPLALLSALCCLAANTAFSYVTIRFLLHRPVVDWLRRHDKSLPQLQSRPQWRVIALVRSSPTPWLLQNAVLVIGGARFWPFLLWTLPIQGAIGATIVTIGEAALQGHFVWAGIGLGVFVALSLVLSALWRRSTDRLRGE